MSPAGEAFHLCVKTHHAQRAHSLDTPQRRAQINVKRPVHMPRAVYLSNQLFPLLLVWVGRKTSYRSSPHFHVCFVCWFISVAIPNCAAVTTAARASIAYGPRYLLCQQKFWEVEVYWCFGELTCGAYAVKLKQHVSRSQVLLS